MPHNYLVITMCKVFYCYLFCAGLNVYSMLKHDTLVLTLSAVEEIEAKLLFHMNRTDGKEVAAQTRKKEYV